MSRLLKTWLDKACLLWFGTSEMHLNKPHLLSSCMQGTHASTPPLLSSFAISKAVPLAAVVQQSLAAARSSCPLCPHYTTHVLSTGPQPRSSLCRRPRALAVLTLCTAGRAPSLCSRALQAAAGARGQIVLRPAWVFARHSSAPTLLYPTLPLCLHHPCSPSLAWRLPLACLQALAHGNWIQGAKKVRPPYS